MPRFTAEELEEAVKRLLDQRRASDERHAATTDHVARLDKQVGELTREFAAHRKESERDMQTISERIDLHHDNVTRRLTSQDAAIGDTREASKDARELARETRADVRAVVDYVQDRRAEMQAQAEAKKRWRERLDFGVAVAKAIGRLVLFVVGAAGITRAFAFVLELVFR